MSFNRFMQSAGFKILSIAKLDNCEYSIVLYLINCAISGLEQIVTTENEIASLIGYNNDAELRSALISLSEKKIIILKYSDKTTADTQLPSMRIGMQFETSRWLIGKNKEENVNDAIIYPFRRSGENLLKVLDGESTKNKKPAKTLGSKETWARIQDQFARGRALNTREMEEAEKFAKVLVDIHPVDQVLIYLKHFSLRIPSLNLLASSWQHYQELFEAETQKIDLMEARQKHMELDEALRADIKNTLDKAESLELSEEDCSILNVLLNHKHPRRQLFWAFQLRNRYKKLADFFESNASIMIPITSAGLIIRKPTQPKDKS